MPIGASKVGALGGLVPGGSVTFNAPGTFSIPPGVKKVSITGNGGTGNPGNSGNPGNAGNLGTGGGGGAGGGGNGDQSGAGGGALGGVDGNFTNRSKSGGPRTSTGSSPGAAGQTGFSGCAGTAGTAGSAGNPGQASSGLGNTFPGGAGGNAGAAGSAGNGGSGGAGGSGGGGGTGGAGGSGGSAAGSGSPGGATNRPDNDARYAFSGSGGGGAGDTNAGVSAVNLNAATQANLIPGASGYPNVLRIQSRPGRGGTSANYSSPLANTTSPDMNMTVNTQGPYPTNNTATNGGIGSRVNWGPAGPCALVHPGLDAGVFTIGKPGGGATCVFRNDNQPSAWKTPYPLANPASNAVRSGGGGGGGATNWNTFPQIVMPAPTPGNSVQGAGGGGGGGRGSAGNPGGAGGAGGTGGAGTPATFNCVPVTPGGTAPITVASPGGQIVISWNPQ